LTECIEDGSFALSLEAACGCAVAADSVVFLVAARAPTFRPTPAPSQPPTPSPTRSMCAYTFLGCGASAVGDNTASSGHAGSFNNHPSGDVNYVVLVAARSTRLTVSTCGGGGTPGVVPNVTNFATRLSVYKQCPGLDPGASVADQDSSLSLENGCSTLVYDAEKAGTYWLVVEGQTAADEGQFEVYAS
jgi:hypothetical protein